MMMMMKSDDDDDEEEELKGITTPKHNVLLAFFAFASDRGVLERTDLGSGHLVARECECECECESECECECECECE